MRFMIACLAAVAAVAFAAPSFAQEAAPTTPTPIAKPKVGTTAYCNSLKTTSSKTACLKRLPGLGRRPPATPHHHGAKVKASQRPRLHGGAEGDFRPRPAAAARLLQVGAAVPAVDHRRAAAAAEDHLTGASPTVPSLSSRESEMAHSASLISTEDLARQMGAPALRVFDCTTYLRPRPEGGYDAESGRANYDKGHIPGAAFLDFGADFSDPASPHRFTLPSLEVLTRAFAAKGIGHGTFVVLYSHAEPTWATRFWWMLRAIGFDDAAILDGGLTSGRQNRPPRPRPRSSTGDTHLAPAPGFRRQERDQVGDRQVRHPT